MFIDPQGVKNILQQDWQSYWREQHLDVVKRLRVKKDK
jgi:hypothetical protein